MWELRIGGKSVVAGKNYLPDQLMLLFGDRDRRFNAERYADLVLRAEAEEEWVGGRRSRLLSYSSRAGLTKQRLELQGFSSAVVRRRAEDYITAELDDDDRYVPEGWGDRETAYADPSELLDAVVTWRMTSATSSRPDADPLFYSWWEQLTEAFDDPRFAVALGLQGVRGNTAVLLDLTDLLLGGWVEADEHPHKTARQRLVAEVAASGPVIVITEGRTDAQLLRRVVDLGAPGFADAFSFLDFDATSTPGGVDRVVSLTRGMAASGVMNRVIAVLDNDSAGRGAARELYRSSLPSRMTVTLLPDVSYANRYPTRGPDGDTRSNVNGRAVAIEMMFGTRILREANNGTLPSVRWGGYVASVNDYQGQLDRKREVQEHLTDALQASTLDELPGELRSGVRRLVTMLVNAAADATPMMTSEYSPLLGTRIRH